jgi:hypothetical protein
MRRIIVLATIGTLLASCQTISRPPAATSIETHEAMVDGLNPAAMAIWDVSDKARSETEGLDPAMMDEAAWLTIRSAAQSMESSSHRMAEAEIIRVGNHTAVEAGFANRAEIQAKIDADPKRFRELSRKMAADAHQLAAAATERNLRRTKDLSDSLNSSCQTCHTQYWEKPGS